MLKRATSLLGLVACFVSCAGAERGGPPVVDRFEPPRPVAAWVDQPPVRCAVGSSGPTLNPRNAIRYSRVAAIDALAAGSLSVDVQSITGTGSRGEFEMTTQSLSGVLADARIAALWAETNPGMQGRARLRQVHALACFPDADLSGLPDLEYPRWLIEAPSAAERVCATGISGPTWKAEDQEASALGDARLALAIALESRIEKRVFDDGRGVARMAREIDPSPSALRRAAGAEALEERWLDEDGEGPLGLPGVLYGLVCVE
ncbi:MAG: hypothetical protein NXI30_00965 [bacterium]|nr:hypothetical protein [bacterium]